MFPAGMSVPVFEVTTFCLLVPTSLLVVIIHRGLQAQWILCIAFLLNHMRIIMFLVSVFAGVNCKSGQQGLLKQ